MPARVRLPAVLLAALVVAEGAVLLLRPRDPVPEPVPVEPRAYFSEAHLTRADDFRSGQRWLYGARLAIEAGVLVILIVRAPRLLARRPMLAGAVAGAAIPLVLSAATLPVAAEARQRAMDVGLVTQSWGGWAGDLARSQAIAMVLGGAGGALVIFGMRRFGRRWWMPGAAVVLAFGVLTTYAGPIVLDPIFNRFQPLEAGKVRSAVVELAERADIDVGEVYVMDASRRTTAANAYVAGIGSTKRVVLYDNLLEDFDFDEVRLVVAHELAHVHHRDLPNGLLYLAIVAPLGMLAVARLAEAMGGRPERPARAVAATTLAIALVVPAVTAVSNQLSRAIEARADAYAIELTGEPAAQIAFQRRIAVQNVSDVDPPEIWHWLFGTHPTTVERIGMAEALR